MTRRWALRPRGRGSLRVCAALVVAASGAAVALGSTHDAAAASYSVSVTPSSSGPPNLRVTYSTDSCVGQAFSYWWDQAGPNATPDNAGDAQQLGTMPAVDVPAGSPCSQSLDPTYPSQSTPQTPQCGVAHTVYAFFIDSSTPNGAPLAGTLASVSYTLPCTGGYLTVDPTAGNPSFSATYTYVPQFVTQGMNNCPASATATFLWDEAAAGGSGQVLASQVPIDQSTCVAGPVSLAPTGTVACGPHQVYASSPEIGAGSEAAPASFTVPCPTPTPTATPTPVPTSRVTPTPTPRHRPTTSSTSRTSSSTSTGASSTSISTTVDTTTSSTDSTTSSQTTPVAIATPHGGVAGITSPGPPPPAGGGSSGLRRSLLAATTVDPTRVLGSPGRIALDALIAALLILVIVFPSELFNGTLEENYEEVRGWFARPLGALGGARSIVGGLPSWLMYPVITACMAALYGLLDPQFGFDESSLLLFLGLVAGLVVVTVGFDLPSVLHARVLNGERAYLRPMAGTLVIAGVCVLISRIAHFQPGYLYGLVAGFTFRGSLAKRDEGRALAVSAATVFALSLVAWVVWIPVKSAAEHPDPTALAVFLDAMLATVFVAGLETAMFGLIPMRFLDGDKVIAWSRSGWLVLMGLGAFGFVHVLLDPSSGFIGWRDDTSAVTVFALFAVFGAASLAFWGYFRIRGEREDEPEAGEPALGT